MSSRTSATEFDHMMSRLQTLITAQRQLLHDVSHEIRSPMARIQAAIGLAHRQPEQALAMMERIERECVRVDRLVGEMLALSRLQAGVDNHLSEEFDVHELLSDIVEDAQFEAATKERSISVRSEVHGTIRGNVELLRRAVENVLRNAIKYSKSGSVITLETARGPAGRSVVISVQDEGTGVPDIRPEEYFRAVFPQRDPCPQGGQRPGPADRQAGGRVPWRHDQGGERPDRRIAGQYRTAGPFVRGAEAPTRQRACGPRLACGAPLGAHDRLSTGLSASPAKP